MEQAQKELPGTRPMSMVLPEARRNKFLTILGQRIALQSLSADLKKLQKQHPAVAGITLALALIDRDDAVLASEVGRIVLTVAAAGGLPLENHAIATEFGAGEITLRAVGDETEMGTA